MADTTINPMSNTAPMSGVVDRPVAQNQSTSMIDQNGFLKIFIEGLKNQDPMAPMSNAEMMEQLTQMTNIENTMLMKEAVEKLVKKEEGVNPIKDYLELMGTKVKVQTDSGFEEGQVLSVGKSDNDIVFEFTNGKSYSVSQIVGASLG